MITVKNFMNFFIVIGVTSIFLISMDSCPKRNLPSMWLHANISGRFPIGQRKYDTLIGRLKTNESIDCRSDWVEVHSMFGLCKQFVPTGPKWKGRFYDSSIMSYKLWLIEMMRKPWKNAKAKTTFGRKSAISIVASYNQTDWTSGWNHFIQGCTIFINPEFELTLVSGSFIQNDLKWPNYSAGLCWTQW